MKETIEGACDFAALAALGFGPGSALMSDAKLLVDRGFLASLLEQFEQELGARDASLTWFQIGLMRGLLDAERAVGAGQLSRAPAPTITAALAPPLLMQLFPSHDAPRRGAVAFSGCWPDGHESDARLAKLGESDAPSCALSAGYTSGWLSGTFQAEILVIEESCRATGDTGCRFVAREVNDWRASSDPRAAELLEAIRIEPLRELATHQAAAENAESGAESGIDLGEGFDSEASVVHLWGPVLVLPFASPDYALQAIELLSRDSETAEIRVVVVDLRGAILDAGFGAAALEQALETIEGWGAEVMLTGVSPLCEDVVAEIEREHLVLRKDMAEAIASAFQIADAQRHLL